MQTCLDCDGTRLSAQARSTLVDGIDLSQATAKTLDDLLAWAPTLAATVPEHMRPMADSIVCFTGALSGEWTIPDFSPFAVIPFGVRLTVYGGGATDLPPAVFDHQLRSIAAGRLKPAIAKFHHGLDQVPQAHTDLEAGGTPGKHVVVLD